MLRGCQCFRQRCFCSRHERDAQALEDFEGCSINGQTSILVDIETAWWAAGPGADTLGGSKSRIGWVAVSVRGILVVIHDVGDHRVDGSLELGVINVD